jgi:hypothetical protein
MRMIRQPSRSPTVREGCSILTANKLLARCVGCIVSVKSSSDDTTALPYSRASAWSALRQCVAESDGRGDEVRTTTR